MKKMLSMVVLGVVLVGGLFFAVNTPNHESEQVVEEVVAQTKQTNGPKLHWFHEDKYPTAEQLERFHTHKGQFPLESAPLVKQN